MLGLLEPPREPVGYAFLGAYVYALGAVLRGYVRNDLRPKSYSHITVRTILVIVLAWVLQLQWSGDVLLALGFFAGLVPRDCDRPHQGVSAGRDRAPVLRGRAGPAHEARGYRPLRPGPASRRGVTSVEGSCHGRDSERCGRVQSSLVGSASATASTTSSTISSGNSSATVPVQSNSGSFASWSRSCSIRSTTGVMPVRISLAQDGHGRVEVRDHIAVPGRARAPAAASGEPGEVVVHLRTGQVGAIHPRVVVEARIRQGGPRQVRSREVGALQPRVPKRGEA